MTLDAFDFVDTQHQSLGVDRVHGDGGRREHRLDSRHRGTVATGPFFGNSMKVARNQ
jgi:hypothetical protein